MIKMFNLSEYIASLAGMYNISDVGFNSDFVKFLISNNWFGASPVVKDGAVFVENDFAEKYNSHLIRFCEQYSNNYDAKIDYLNKELYSFAPQTVKMLKKYVKAVSVEENVIYRLADFLLANLPGELPESTDTEVGTLVGYARDELPKSLADYLTDFVNWVKCHTKTSYQGVYIMEQYATKEDTSTAYDPDVYLEILYRLYNFGYINDNDMYAQAAASKNYADTWLFLSLHFLCSLRNTDLMRLPHPTLPTAPEEILEKIGSGTFGDDEAKAVLYSIVWTLEALIPAPNKTQRYSGIGSIKFHVPESVEVHIGTLFSLAEAHFRLASGEPEKPLIRIIQSYEQINRYMGEEIGDLFLESNFHSRAANKSYMQMIYLLTDDILGKNDEFNIKGYMLAALARSHKGSYGDFAKTTSVYLKDAKMSGYTPEFVAKELFERGVLSSIPAMLLKMVTDGEFNKLSVSSQTKMIQSLGMSPVDVERSVEVAHLNMKRSIATVGLIYKGCTKEQIMEILHRIGNGEAVSKCDGCLCLMTAMKVPCPHPENHNCPSCQYEISTKSTMFLMARECKRLNKLYNTTKNPVEKKRSSAVAQGVVIPAIEEMLSVMEETYGQEAVESLERIISEAMG